MTAYLTGASMDVGMDMGGPIRYNISLSYVSFEPISLESIPREIDFNNPLQMATPMAMGQAMGGTVSVSTSLPAAIVPLMTEEQIKIRDAKTAVAEDSSTQKPKKPLPKKIKRMTDFLEV